jgi:hypothetical protein
MRMRFFLWLALMPGVCALSGCGGGPPAEPKGYREFVGTVVPLTGKILLDGAAPKDVSIAALKADLLVQEVQQQKSGGEFESLAVGGIVKPDGTFAFTTLSYADGLPAGDYIILFRKISMNDPGKPPDRKVAAFNRKYANPETSKFKVSVEADKPLDMGTIELASPP